MAMNFRHFGVSIRTTFPTAISCERQRVRATLAIVYRAVSSQSAAVAPENAKPILDDRIKPTKSKPDAVRHFVDYQRVHANAGSGGAGMMSFLSLFKNQFAGPDGGDGGNGGHVIFQADPQIRSLGHLRGRYTADSGAAGRSRCCHGKSAEHLTVKVPVGTVFKDLATGKVLCDLKKADALFIAARGGAGGHGNQFYLSNQVRAPMDAEKGGKGEHKVYDVELRIIAHAGLVGFPNAGKSTLLRAISRARPKVAAYPFTTLNPYVGMVEYDDYEQLAVADIPGLVSGAHQNYGLGFSFLRHVERCLCLFYVIDLSLSEPWSQLDDLKFELEQYQSGLSSRPHAIVGNKIDLEISQRNLELLKERSDLPIFPISAKDRDGLEPLLDYFRKLFEEHKSSWYSDDTTNR